MRCFKPSGSFSQTRYCTKTRRLFMPTDLAHPNSWSIVFGSKVSFCHISVVLVAVRGR